MHSCSAWAQVWDQGLESFIGKQLLGQNVQSSCSSYFLCVAMLRLTSYKWGDMNFFTARVSGFCVDLHPSRRSVVGKRCIGRDVKHKTWNVESDKVPEEISDDLRMHCQIESQHKCQIIWTSGKTMSLCGLIEDQQFAMLWQFRKMIGCFAFPGKSSTLDFFLSPQPTMTKAGPHGPEGWSVWHL